jgi:hypothetical protein
MALYRLVVHPNITVHFHGFYVVVRVCRELQTSAHGQKDKQQRRTCGQLLSPVFSVVGMRSSVRLSDSTHLVVEAQDFVRPVKQLSLSFTQPCC